jgi:hypothetical protein
MGDKRRHRVWAFSLLAWAALVTIPTAFISMSWMLGIITDSSVPNVFDLFPFAFLFSLPAAIVVFALLVPFALAADHGLRGRTTRTMNIALGAALGIMTFAVFFAGSALLRLPTPFTPRRIIADGASLDTLSRMLTAPQAAAIVAMFVVSGMLVGLGLRHRAAAVRPARLPSLPVRP